MIDVELPDGPGPSLVRGVAACLASVTEAPDLPLPPGDAPLEHALGLWRGWLAGRGSGLVPIADPRTFAWAGWWVAVVDGSTSPLADGPHRRVAVLAFGTPPGVVLSPQDASLLGLATAELPVHAAYAVASLDPVLRPPAAAAPASGTVAGLAVAAAAGAPMTLVETARAIAGCGLEGDRYADGAGTFSPRAAHRPGFELTLIAAEVVEELGIAFPATRRNVLTRGVDVNALVGRDIRIGDVLCRGLRLAEPCAHLERLSGPGLLRPLIARGGLRADVVHSGEISVGDPVTA